MAGRIRPCPPTANITASAPRPSVIPRTVSPASPWKRQSSDEGRSLSYCKPRRIQIGSNHPCPGPFRQSRQDQSNRTLAHNQHRLARLQPRVSIPLMHVFTGSAKDACSKLMPSGNTHRPLLDNPVHHPDIFGKTSARRLESRRAPNLLVGGALGKVLCGSNSILRQGIW